MKLKHSVALVINGHGFFAFVHQSIEGIGMAAAISIAGNVFENWFSKLPNAEKIVLRIAFENKQEILDSSKISIISIENGDNVEVGADSLLFEIVNKLHEKIIN